MIAAWLKQAETELGDILEFVNAYNPEKSLALFHEFLDCARQLERFPEMGRMVPELRQANIRELIVDKTYRFIHKVGTEHVFIIAIRHGRQNLDPAELEQRADFEE